MKRVISDEIKKAVEVLRNGGIILYPTDTIWGIGCDATNQDAVKRIYAIKEREDSKSMITLVDTYEKIPIYVENMPEVARDLIEVADKPVTIIYSNGKNVAPCLIAEDNSLAIRVTREQVSNDLCYYFGKPIVSTSANKSGKKSPRFFNEITEYIKEAVDYIIPMRQGEMTMHAPSSIIKIENNGAFKIIR